MKNVTGLPVIGEDLYGRARELADLWEKLEEGEHVLMLAPRRVGKTSLMQELQRAPRERWTVIYVDVQGGDGPADCVAAILAALAADPRHRSRFEAMPFSNAVKGVVQRLQAVSLGVGPLRVELKGAIGREWGHAADQLQAYLTTLAGADGRLLVIMDELPFLVSRMLRAADGRHEAELLLSRLRQWRQAPELRGKVHTLVGGSIGLEGVLRRVGLSGLINDLSPFQLDSWGRPTAAGFLKELGAGYDFRLGDESIARLLDLLWDPVPYHVQLFFSTLRSACKSDPSRVSLETINQCFEDRLAGPRGTAHLDHYADRLGVAFDEREHKVARDILGRVCRREAGARLTDLEDLHQESGDTFRSVLRDLEADGYVERNGRRLQFRSNLLRGWWRRRHARGETP